LPDPAAVLRACQIERVAGSAVMKGLHQFRWCGL
jgi:hypothetical protein